MTDGVVFVFVDFLRNHNTLINFDECFGKGRNGAILIHIGHNCRMFLERDMSLNVKIVTTLLGLPYLKMRK